MSLYISYSSYIQPMYSVFLFKKWILFWWFVQCIIETVFKHAGKSYDFVITAWWWCLYCNCSLRHPTSLRNYGCCCIYISGWKMFRNVHIVAKWWSCGNCGSFWPQALVWLPGLISGLDTYNPSTWGEEEEEDNSECLSGPQHTCFWFFFCKGDKRKLISTMSTLLLSISNPSRVPQSRQPLHYGAKVTQGGGFDAACKTSSCE